VGKQLRRCRREGGLNGGRGKRKKQLLSPFPSKVLDCQKIVGNFFVRKLLSKNAKFGKKTFPFWKKIMDKFEILSPHNFNCRKFATRLICQNFVKNL